MKFMFAAILLAGTLAPHSRPTPAPACVCAPPPVPKAVERASAVFVGAVVDIVEPATTDNDAPLPGKYFTIKFKVEKSWKGVTSGEVSILSGQGKYSCFDYPPVSKGERYLVYADAIYYFGASQRDWPIITECNRTALVPDPDPLPTDRDKAAGLDRKDAFADLEELERLRVSGFDFDR